MIDIEAIRVNSLDWLGCAESNHMMLSATERGEERKRYEEAVRKYDADRTWALFCYPNKHEYLMQALISLDLQPNDVLLDIGCGDARLSLMALRDFGIKEAIAIEWCEDWVKETKKFIKKKKWQLPDNLTYEANTYQDFDFPDRVTKCVFLAHHNGQKTLDNVKEKLKSTKCSIFVHNFGHQDSVLVEVI